MLLGNNDEHNKITIKGDSVNNTNLVIEPKQISGFNKFRPIGIRSGNTLVIEDNAILQNSKIPASEGGFNSFGGGMINVANNSTLEMKGGIIRSSSV